MKSKYEKPYAQNLGSKLPDALGYCQMGSTAGGLGTSCRSFGSSASDGGCVTGGFAGTNPNESACISGTRPSADVGCQTGESAAKNCISGEGH